MLTISEHKKREQEIDQAMQDYTPSMTGGQSKFFTPEQRAAYVRRFIRWRRINGAILFVFRGRLGKAMVSFLYELRRPKEGSAEYWLCHRLGVEMQQARQAIACRKELRDAGGENGKLFLGNRQIWPMSLNTTEEDDADN
jgi:hypothetical protein